MNLFFLDGTNPPAASYHTRLMVLSAFCSNRVWNTSIPPFEFDVTYGQDRICGLFDERYSPLVDFFFFKKKKKEKRKKGRRVHIPSRPSVITDERFGR